MLLSDVCLSVVYIGSNSRIERPRKTKIATEVAHVTRDSYTSFKVKRSKVKATRPLCLVVLAGQHGHTVMVTYPYAYMTYIVSPLAGLGGGISWQPPAYSLLKIFYYFITHEKCLKLVNIKLHMYIFNAHTYTNSYIPYRIRLLGQKDIQNCDIELAYNDWSCFTTKSQFPHNTLA